MVQILEGEAVRLHTKSVDCVWGNGFNLRKKVQGFMSLPHKHTKTVFW